MALGATAGNVQGQVLRETMGLALAGIAVGLVASVALARLIATLLYETSPADPMTFVATGALLLTVAALAGYLPALRASRVDPMTALGPTDQGSRASHALGARASPISKSATPFIPARLGRAGGDVRENPRHRGLAVQRREHRVDP